VVAASEDANMPPRHDLPQWTLLSSQEPARQRNKVYCRWRRLLRVGDHVVINPNYTGIASPMA